MRLAPIKQWTGNATTSDIVAEPTPPASVEYLLLADFYPVAVALTYCQPALCYDGISTNLTTRHFGVMAPPAVVAGRAWVTHCGPMNGGTQQSDTTIENTSSVSPNGVGDGTAAAADVITTPSQALGATQYLDIATDPALVAYTLTGDLNQASPSATVDRMLELAEALAAAVEEVSIVNSCGFGLAVAIRTGDLETL